MSFDSIAYSTNNRGKHCVFVIYIHTCKCTTLIFILMRFGLLHWYNIQDNTGWLFFIQSYTVFKVLFEIFHFLLNIFITVTSIVCIQQHICVVSIVACERDISILRKLRFGVCHQCQYTWLIFCLCYMPFRTLQCDC